MNKEKQALLNEKRVKGAIVRAYYNAKFGYQSGIKQPQMCRKILGAANVQCPKGGALELLRAAHQVIKDEGFKKPSRAKAKKVRQSKAAFYKSWDWRTLRTKILEKYGRRCMCCGATPEHTDMAGDPVKIVVDHIKPISKHWGLRLEPGNLQVLCDECNQGKGAWNETDHRGNGYLSAVDERRTLEVHRMTIQQGPRGRTEQG